jgi:uncharacterized protein
MPVVSQLFIYPIKSFGGISLSEVQISDRGFQYDRRWMLVDDNNRFITQREEARLALLQTAITSNGIAVYPKDNPGNEMIVPFQFEPREALTVSLFDDSCQAVTIDPLLNDWFSEWLQLKCKLVYMPDACRRRVDARYARNTEDITAFSDGYPILLLSEASLANLNSRLPEALPVNRFRPNLVISHTDAYEEDRMEHFIINNIPLYGVKLCARCVITTINQQTIAAGKEPLKTLSAYRMRNNKVYFGQNVLPAGMGKIRTGDAVVIKKRAENPFFDAVS